MIFPLGLNKVILIFELAEEMAEAGFILTPDQIINKAVFTST